MLLRPFSRGYNVPVDDAAVAALRANDCVSKVVWISAETCSHVRLRLRERGQRSGICPGGLSNARLQGSCWRRILNA